MSSDCREGVRSWPNAFVISEPILAVADPAIKPAEEQAI